MRSDRVTERPASRQLLAALLSAVFVVSLGYGIVLPVLPAMVSRLAATTDPSTIARHVGLLTAAYVAAPLAVAILWGRLSDALGRRPVLVFGLLGFAATLVATAVATNLPMFYAGRILCGAFAAAVAPTTMAFIADLEVDNDRRARAFGRVGMAAIAGFFVGPMIGALTSGWSRIPALPNLGPFLPAAILAAISAVAIRALLPAGIPSLATVAQEVESTPSRVGTTRLLVLAGAAAIGLGAFEVGLTLRSGERALAPSDLAVVFATCSVVMFVVQGIVFSPLIKSASTRWFIAPGFGVMALGLALLPGIRSLGGVLAALALVSASAGVISPLLSYWVSRQTSAQTRGVGLGIQSAATSLGQAIGSAGAGLLYGLNGEVGTAFYAAASIAAIAAIASLSLSQKLAQTSTNIRSGEGNIERR